MCGGTFPGRVYTRSIIGLSPRVRGNPDPATACDHRPGSIPACAGEPRSAPVPSRAAGVYPRVCGGTSSQAGLWRTPAGLSPRVRGNRSIAHCSSAVIRSIPACAGEPELRPPLLVAGQVYPRVCGGTSLRVRRMIILSGLSPRVRGNRPPCALPAGADGSIPACAGEPRYGAGPDG